MKQYREEIDGLRALAVISVILFHADFDWFSGGFVGVDVFFVISGYLITSNILAEKEAGTFSLASFYERRARRILPAFFFVVLFCGIPAWLWMSPSQLKDYAQSVVAGSVFSSNILFLLEDDYFTGIGAEKPLLHTWSLAVEEQYYLIFPVFILIFWTFGRRWLIGALSVIAIVSLGISEWGWRNYPGVNFYLTPARAWELLIGALLALVSFEAPFHERVRLISRQALSGAGLALVLLTIFAYDDTTPFPSVYAVIPTVGTALIIGFGGQSTYVGRLLSLRAFVGVGLISYSAYLWHQPLFAFARIRSLHEPSNILFGSLIIATFALAYLTWRYVEKPFRYKQSFSRGFIFTMATVNTAAFIIVGLFGHFAPQTFQRAALPGTMSSSFGHAKGFNECFDASLAQIQSRDFVCDIGVSKDDKRSFLIVGDSHAKALAPAFDAAAIKVNLKGYFAANPACAPLLGVYFVSTSNLQREKCELFNKAVFDFAKNNNVRDVILIAKWSGYTNEVFENGKMHTIFISRTVDGTQSITESRIAFEEGLARTVNAYEAIGTRVHVVEQVPRQVHIAEKVYYLSILQNGKVDVYHHSVSFIEHRALQNFPLSVLKRLKNESYLTVVSLDKVFCDDQKCKLGSTDGSFYADRSHLSSFGTKQAIPFLEDFLSENLG